MLTLPVSEWRYLAQQGREVVDSLNPDYSFKDLLHGVANKYRTKEAGWEEAVLSGKFMRYPSEVQEQTFCGEEATRNYLLLRTLGVPCEYGIMRNCDGDKRDHDFVIAGRDRKHLLDWSKVYENIEIKEKEITIEGGKQFHKFDKLEFISHENVISGLNEMRSGQKITESLKDRQMMFQEFNEWGQTELYASMSAENTIGFITCFYPITGRMTKYFARGITFDKEDKDKICVKEELGIIRNTTRGKTELFSFIQSYNSDGGFHSKKPLTRKITKDQRRALRQELLYYRILKEKQKKYVYPEKKLNDFMIYMCAASQHEGLASLLSKNFILRYTRIHKQSEETAKRYLDYELFWWSTQNNTISSSTKEISLEDALKMYGIENEEQELVGHATLAMRNMGFVYAQGRHRRLEDAIVRRVASELGRPVPESLPPNIISYPMENGYPHIIKDRMRFGGFPIPIPAFVNCL
jgi:hypothetical protein